MKIENNNFYKILGIRDGKGILDGETLCNLTSEKRDLYDGRVAYDAELDGINFVAIHKEMLVEEYENRNNTVSTACGDFM
jgi:hypothetical protein